MNKESVLKISGLTAEQKQFVENWFKAPANRGKEMEGDAASIKKMIAEKIAAKKKKDETKGNYSMVKDLVQSLCKGTRQKHALYTYAEIVEIINQATEEKKAAFSEIQQLEEELRQKKAALGLKR